ncbi:hypothetical protein E2C01_059167 [Portunus trituberculatus]|uniref:Uncharacterized protein n=1 Tax=Portunus trituberculatus TaxID=210409 RepID=A0A5B7H4M6_PORTR|nr:hypothetical protein [Portunus trituberculatus]
MYPSAGNSSGSRCYTLLCHVNNTQTTTRDSRRPSVLSLEPLSPPTTKHRPRTKTKQLQQKK